MAKNRLATSFVPAIKLTRGFAVLIMYIFILLSLLKDSDIRIRYIFIIVLSLTKDKDKRIKIFFAGSFVSQIRFEFGCRQWAGRSMLHLSTASFVV